MFHIHILQSFCFPFFVIIYNLSCTTDIHNPTRRVVSKKFEKVLGAYSQNL